MCGSSLSQTQCERSLASATVPRAARTMEEVRQAALGARQRAIERSDAEERQRKGQAALVAKGGLSKGQVLAFFAENQRLLDLPETRERCFYLGLSEARERYFYLGLPETRGG